MSYEYTPEEIWELLKEKKRVFLTGGGGVGKSFSTRAIMDLARDEDYDAIPTATTGIAARGLSSYGTTINSCLKIGITNSIDEYAATDSKKRRYIKTNITSPRSLLIIDEISMSSADALDLYLHVINSKQLSNILILLVGDPLQLGPVMNKLTKEEKPMFFKSMEFGKFHNVILTKNKRNTNVKWNIFLNRIRKGICSQDDEKFLFEHCNASQIIFDATIAKSADKDRSLYEPVSLEAVNADVDLNNIYKLLELEGEIVNFSRRVSFPVDTSVKRQNEIMEKEIAFHENNTITPAELSLKIGAKVMVTKNIGDKNVVNGDIGIVLEMYEDVVVIELLNGNIIDLGYTSWEIRHPTEKDIKTGEHKIIASWDMIPLKLAYFISVHKSQGMSIPNLKINPTKFFAEGMLYTALSRSSGRIELTDYNIGKYMKYNKDAVNFVNRLEMTEQRRQENKAKGLN
jgi:ATP-dependent DNA helicase PIF1